MGAKGLQKSRCLIDSLIFFTINSFRGDNGWLYHVCVDRRCLYCNDLTSAKAQLKSAVRAPPTWSKPVGDGAKRTRTELSLNNDIEIHKQQRILFFLENRTQVFVKRNFISPINIFTHIFS